MVEDNVAVQVVSHAATSQRAMRIAPKVRAANDEMHARASDPANRGRFRGFCALAMAFPDEAAAELRRCVGELGFVGALADAHSVGEGGDDDGCYFYGSPAYDALWSALVEFGLPIYLHPCYPPRNEMLSEGGPYNDVVLGHMGEMVPNYLDRVAVWRLRREGRNVTDVYANNVHVTFGGYFSLAPMHTLLDVTDTSRIMSSVDYPFENNTVGKEFMEELRASGLVSEE
ncbi:hypothetical protein RB596_009945 [Gaeumannomyces avenae]